LPALLASAVPNTIQEVGAIAGIISFVLMLTLLGLYIVRAIELRRLRRTMPFLADPANANGQAEKDQSRGAAD
jgi:hypothetical protein